MILQVAGYITCQVPEFLQGIVDGSEIQRSPVEEKGSLSHYLLGFSTIPGGCLGFLNHQQYDWKTRLKESMLLE